MINSNNFDMPDEYEVHVRHHQTNGDPPNNDDHDSNEQQQHHYNDSVLVHVGMDREEEHDVDVDVDEEVVPLTSSSSSSPASSIMDANHNNNINNNMYEKRGLRRVVSMNSTINCNKSRVLLLVAISFAWISSMWHHDRSPEIETISSSSYNQRHTSDYFPPRMVIIGLGDNEESSSLGLYDTNHTISSSYQEIPSYYTKESIVNKNATLITTAATVDWRHQDEVARAHTIAKQGDACGLEPTYARPTCNFMHETSLQPQFPFMKLGNGQKRIAYKLELEMMVGSLVGDSDSDLHINNSNNTETMTSTSTVVGVAFKSSSTKTKTSPDTQKVNRMDAMTAERLTFSNNVVNIYSYCGESTLLELAANDFSHHVPHVSGILSPQTILEYARDAAIALGDLHSISYPNFPAGIMIHRDIRPWNFLVSKESNQLQLHDFNAGRFVPWHNSEEDDHENEDGNDITNSSSTASATTATTNTNNTTPKRLCHWQHKPVKCNSNRSPEECSSACYLTDKTDVYNLGNFFYFLLTSGKLPYSDMIMKEKKEKKSASKAQNTKTLIHDMIRAGTLAKLPHAIRTSKDPATVALREARVEIQRLDPNDRPTSAQLAAVLSSIYDTIYGKTAGT